MSIFNDKSLKGVAEEAAKVMEELKGKQHKLDVAEPKGKLTKADFDKLRSMKKEDIENIEEARSTKDIETGRKAREEIEAHEKALLDKEKELMDRWHKRQVRANWADRAERGNVKEDVDSIEEASYSAKAARAGKDIGKPGKMFSKIAASAAKRYGSEESGKRVAGAILKKLRMGEAKDYEPEAPDAAAIARRKKLQALQDKREDAERESGEKKKYAVRKVEGKAYGGAKQKDEMDESVLSFSEILENYAQNGLKSFSSVFVREEPDNEQFTKEVETAQAKSEGKGKKAKVGAAAVQAVEVQKEEAEQIDELSKDTLKSYKSKAQDDAFKSMTRRTRAHQMAHQGDDEDLEKAEKTDKEETKNIEKRNAGIKMANQKLNKEEFDMDSINDINGVKISNIDERELSDAEMQKREEYARGMKKKLSGFKKRYGERAKEVMYATATKMAKKD